MLARRFTTCVSLLLVSILSGCTFWFPYTVSVTLGDLDGDSDLDALVSNGHTDDTGEPNTVWINLGGAQGGSAGVFVDSHQQLGEHTEHTFAASLADLDDDGDLDAIFASNPYLGIWLNQGQADFIQHSRYLLHSSRDSASSAHAAAVGDLDADGDPDIFAASCCRSHWVSSNGQGIIDQGVFDSPDWVLFNQGLRADGHLDQFVIGEQVLDNRSSLEAALGDLDADGDLDALVGGISMPESPAQPGAQVYFNDGSGSFTSGPAFSNADVGSLKVGDLDADGDLDAYLGVSKRPEDLPLDEVWLNQGDGRFENSKQSLSRGDAVHVELHDFNGDERLDVLVGLRSGEAELWWNDGHGNLSDSGLSFRGRRFTAFSAGDVDGNGTVDVLGMHFDSGYRLWLNDGRGSFQLASPAFDTTWLWIGGIMGMVAVFALLWWLPREHHPA